LCGVFLRYGLANYLSGVSFELGSSCLLSSWDYRSELRCQAGLELLIVLPLPLK
jgi:hypothetical protein